MRHRKSRALKEYFTVDLHLHTNRGSADSNLAPAEMIARAQAIGIGAVCITEHDNAWDLRDDQMLIVSGTHCAVRLMALDFASLKEATDQ